MLQYHLDLAGEVHPQFAAQSSAQQLDRSLLGGDFQHAGSFNSNWY